MVRSSRGFPARFGAAVYQQGFDVDHSGIEKEADAVLEEIVGGDEVAATTRFEIVDSRQDDPDIKLQYDGRLERHIRPMVFRRPPDLRFLWADSGNSVAVLLDGEPWAFIREDKNDGYSKGVLDATIGNLWDGKLFEKTFLQNR